MIIDNGTRTEFDTGAVRDIQAGKGRFDLMPLVQVGTLLDDCILKQIGFYLKTGDVFHLYETLSNFFRKISNEEQSKFKTQKEILMQLAIHFEAGALKYGENNWQKGIPVKSYINSAVRHYLKWQAGETDEDHQSAFLWNILCCIWTIENEVIL